MGESRKKWGLERGKEGSQAKHLSTAEYKAKKIVEAAEEKAAETTENAEREAKEYLSSIKERIEEEANKPTPKKRKDAERETQELRTINTAQKIEQERTYKELHSLFEQWRDADKRSKQNENARTAIYRCAKPIPKNLRTCLTALGESSILPFIILPLRVRTAATQSNNFINL